MSLFDENPSQLLPYDGTATLHLDVWDVEQATDIQYRLRHEIEWQQVHVTVFNRRVPQPRLTAWYGDEGKSYSYSGVRLDPQPWSETLANIRGVCGQLSGEEFNSVLANLYRSGDDSVGWHADNERELGPEPIIVSASFGGLRRFDLKHRDTGEIIRVDLPAGSVLVMAGQCQHKWIHRVAKTSAPCGERINLTFRKINV